MRTELTVSGVAERIEGPLLFLRRNINVGVNEALRIVGGDGIVRLGRIATLEEDAMIGHELPRVRARSVRPSAPHKRGEPWATRFYSLSASSPVTASSSKPMMIVPSHRVS